MKYVNLIKFAAVGVALLISGFFVLDYFMEGMITYRSIALSITGMFMVRIFVWLENRKMTYDWLEEQKMTQNRILEKEGYL
ncbi:hypothetical protein [Oceanobacillus jeddahense]|uniref:Uncharacterized protein n=1 Tax=Oceanobacillus jeddahense TaxID=1462527 RepID=A0ABY5JRU7_9BACI|nr:hypothetical protein [Oceanobacillus jeddahense]UUI02851.1 hypothetical protein NP439_22925 [Oceanobacillus jeddahense]